MDDVFQTKALELETLKYTLAIVVPIQSFKPTTPSSLGQNGTFRVIASTGTSQRSGNVILVWFPTVNDPQMHYDRKE